MSTATTVNCYECLCGTEAEGEHPSKCWICGKEMRFWRVRNVLFVSKAITAEAADKRIANGGF